MTEKLIFFSNVEGNLLIRLLLAHVMADFMLQTNKMVGQKKWSSKYMFAHIAIVFVLTMLLSGSLYLAATISLFHWAIDGLKISVKKRGGISDTKLFVGDQLLHIISIVILWSVFSHNLLSLLQAAWLPFGNYKCSLILLGYVLITTPAGFLIKHATVGLNNVNTENVQQGGKWIGIFERIIILTFVLLAQYAAIGFLITGKSILRYTNNDDHLRSEYVLVGTMMSYAIAIAVGAGINWLLGL